MVSPLFISNTPFFLLNANDANLEKLGVHYPAVIMKAHHIEWRPTVAERLKKIADVFIVDPATDIMFFKDAREGKGFKKLKYPKNIEPEKVYSDPGLRKKIIHKALNHQQRNGASLLIAPYFYSEDADHIKFNINLTFISETLRVLEERKITTPLFATLEIGKSVLTSPIVINSIVDRYKEDYSELLSGFIIVINEFDCEIADLQSLVGLSRLVFQLSEKNDVFVNKKGPFGEILSAIGATGFGSSLMGGEVFSERNLQDAPTRRKKPAPKTYIPEVFDYLNDEDVKKVKYSCSCPVCDGSYPKDTLSKKLHYLHTKIQATESLKELSRDQKIKVLSRKINNGIRLTSEWQGRAINVKTTFLPKWKDVLDLAKFWEFPSEDSELNDLLRELES